MFEDDELNKIVRVNVRDEVNKKLKDMGVRNINVCWSPEFVERVNNTTPGPDREALKDQGIHELLRLIQAVENGEYEPLPPFGDATPKRPPEEIEAILRERGMKADW